MTESTGDGARRNALLAWPATPPTSDGVTLRAWRDNDVAAAQAMATCPYIPLTGTLPTMATPAAALAYLRRQQGRHGEGKGFSFCIAEASTDRALGGCGLWLAPDSLTTGRATIGYAVQPDARGRGVATATIRALVHFAWTLPPLHRVEAYIEPWNTASCRAAEHAGLVYVETLPQHHDIDGRRVDMHLYVATRQTARATPA